MEIGKVIIVIDYFACSINGKNRAKNEDRVLAVNKVISDGNSAGKADHEFIAIVCDGVGGNSGGEVAAETVVSGFKDSLKKAQKETETLIQSLPRYHIPDAPIWDDDPVQPEIILAAL